MHTLETPRTKWRGLITLGTIVAFCLGAALFTAQSADARTIYYQPSPSWICKTFGWCKTATYCYQGDPNIAYNVTSPPWRCKTVYY